MTTTLERPVARWVQIGGEPYKLVISPEGLRLTARGHHKGTEVSWDSLIALGDTSSATRDERPSKTDLPTGIAADVARELKSASDALAKARAVLAKAGSLPAQLLAEADSDPVYGRAAQEDHWFVEPLLTPTEVASLFRISRPSLAHLPLRSITVAGETRYRQSEIRRYLRDHER